MTTSKTDSAVSSAQHTVKSRDTGKVYRVIRKYKHTLLVTPAWLKRGYKMTLPKTAFDLAHLLTARRKTMTK